jgi:hypothetical protein
MSLLNTICQQIQGIQKIPGMITIPMEMIRASIEEDTILQGVDTQEEKVPLGVDGLEEKILLGGALLKIQTMMTWMGMTRIMKMMKTMG